eukprot:gene37133-48509_t
MSKQASREEFRSYWVEEHGAPTLENMMLDDNAAAMDVLERPEILAELPSLNSKAVLELGAGIGRFSSGLAEKAASVVAVDFVDASCKINRDSNAKLTNLTVVCEDVLKLTFPPNSFEIVFINWLHMYLSDDEVFQLATSCLNWLKPGGRIFFRESCFHRSGNVPRSWNPTVYRDPRSYFQFYNAARGSDGSRFQLCKTSCVHAYVRMKNNPNQVWWIWEKCTTGHLVQYLDTQQYNYNSVFRYEQMYGPGFISTGGEALIEAITSSEVEVKPGARVLDVGCGLGGNMLHFASKGCYVHGIDISGIMVSIASERYLKYPAAIQQKISVSVADVFDSDFIPNSFDLICCRDFLMHFSESDKQILLSKFHRWLAPGGSVILTDYVVSEKIITSAELTKYVQERGYNLLQVSDYMQIFKNLNFKVKKVDMYAGEKFGDYLKNQLIEYKKLVAVKNETIDRGTNIGNDDELAVMIAQNSADIAKKYVQGKESLVKEENENVIWAQKYWDIRIKSSET